MAYIGWGTADGTGHPVVAPYARANTGILNTVSNGSYACKVTSAYSTVAFSYVWIPTVADVNPVTSTLVSYGAYTLALNSGVGGFSAGSGSIIVSAVIDGVPADNRLVLVCTATVGFYGNVAWAEYGTPAFWTNFVGSYENA